MGPHGACGKMAQVCCVPELVSGTRDLFKAPVKDGGDGKRIQRKGGGEEDTVFLVRGSCCFWYLQTEISSCLWHLRWAGRPRGHTEQVVRKRKEDTVAQMRLQGLSEGQPFHVA